MMAEVANAHLLPRGRKPRIVLSFLQSLSVLPDPEHGDLDLEERYWDDRRTDARYQFGGSLVPLQVGGVCSILRLKNLSCGGAAGISELPLPVGRRVYLELGSLASHAAQVRWTRKTLVGLKFVKPLEERFVLDLYAQRWHFADRIANWPRDAGSGVFDRTAAPKDIGFD